MNEFLNLCALLAERNYADDGMNVERYYSVSHGVCGIETDRNSIKLCSLEGRAYHNATLDEFGRFTSFGDYDGNVGDFCVLYPSKELYMAYPLDPKKAWGVWAKEMIQSGVIRNSYDEIRLSWAAEFA